MAEKRYFKLDPSEKAIYKVAGGIFSAYVISGKVTDNNEKEMEDKAIDKAISLASKVERLIQSDDETLYGE
jgi:hypothetical protein